MLSAVKNLFFPTWVVSTDHVDPNELGLKVGLFVFWYWRGTTPMTTLTWSKRKTWRPVCPQEFGETIVSPQDPNHPARKILYCLSSLEDSIRNDNLSKEKILTWVATEVDYWKAYLDRLDPKNNL